MKRLLTLLALSTALLSANPCKDSIDMMKYHSTKFKKVINKKTWNNSKVYRVGTDLTFAILSVEIDCQLTNEQKKILDVLSESAHDIMDDVTKRMF